MVFHGCRPCSRLMLPSSSFYSRAVHVNRGIVTANRSDKYVEHSSVSEASCIKYARVLSRLFCSRSCEKVPRTRKVELPLAS